MSSEAVKESKAKSWLKKLGIAGFLFFLVKGLIWIVVAAAAYWGWKGC